MLEKGVVWEYRHVNILKSETRTPQHREMHPFGKVPILDLVDDRGETVLRIRESRAIARYIAIAFSGKGNDLMPDISDVNAMASFEEAASMEVSYFSTKAWQYGGDIVIKPILGVPRVDEKTLQDIWNELSGALKAMDGILSSRKYLAGSDFTLVDIWSMPWMSQLIELRAGADVFFSGLPHLRHWWETVSLRPAWQEAFKRAAMSSQDAVAIQRPMRSVRRKRNEYTLIAWYPIPERSNVTANGRVNAVKSEAKSVAIHAVATYQVSTQWSRKYLSAEEVIAPCASADSMSLALNEPSRHSPSGSLNSSLPSSGVPVSDGKSPAARRSSFVDTFKLAKSCLEANGIVRPAEKDDVQGPNRTQSLVLEKPLAFMLEDCAESILELEYDRARRLFSTFVDTIYPIYPCVDLDSVGWLLDALFGRATREGNNQTLQSPPINVTKVDILKALLGLTLLVEDDTTSPLARHLQRHVDWTVEKLVTGTGPDTDDIVMATLMSLYFLHKSEHMKAWRLIGLASRSCYELGLHQASDENQSRAQAPSSLSLRELFCSIYILDRTVSFMTELPYATKDEDIDEECFDLGASAPFLTVTIEYTRLIPEIFALLKPSAKSAVEIRQHKEYLDYQVQRLQDKLRDLTAIAQSSDSFHQDSVLMDDLETFLAVRVNHARIILRKPLLHSYLGDREKQQAAAVSIECAKDAVFLCSRVISKPAPSKFLRAAYEYFLVSSLAIILLIVSQDPRTYGPDSREAFQEAIKILEASKCRHFGSQNLCFTFEQLIKIGEHLYMPKDGSTPVSQDVGDVDLGQFLFDPQCAAPRTKLTIS
ncbi:glutathione S-transferase [Fusarium beomiforme]|uniref:glutathione transferase n=1 Tax=Fusarium beomiforme TaxID=44412 RepID=A0A9P5DU36_9HYPO|nr:glutathione S-transferase [Fusarium beomiforme]